MPKHDIIVIGASAGGVEALQKVVAAFSKDMQAAVFVVLHIGSGEGTRSRLPEVLSRAGPLPAIHPADGDPIEYGRVYVAPPNRHLLVSNGHIELSHGPKENRARPAINPLFRTAALHYRGRVTGVILTGMLDDGVAGLAEIKRRGGVAIVQDPETALYPSMPNHALDAVDVDYVVPLDQIGTLAQKLTKTDSGGVEQDEVLTSSPSGLTCPECRGPLTEQRQGKITEFRCRVGHMYSTAAMAEVHQDTTERSLWAAIVALEEEADIWERRAAELGPRALEKARDKRRQAETLIGLLREGR